MRKFYGIIALGLVIGFSISCQDEATLKPDGTPVNDDGTPVNDDGTPVNDDGTPVNDDGTPVNDDGTPVNDDASRKDKEKFIISFFKDNKRDAQKSIGRDLDTSKLSILKDNEINSIYEKCKTRESKENRVLNDEKFKINGSKYKLSDLKNLTNTELDAITEVLNTRAEKESFIVTFFKNNKRDAQKSIGRDLDTSKLSSLQDNEINSIYEKCKTRESKENRVLNDEKFKINGSKYKLSDLKTLTNTELDAIKPESTPGNFEFNFQAPLITLDPEARKKLAKSFKNKYPDYANILEEIKEEMDDTEYNYFTVADSYRLTPITTDVDYNDYDISLKNKFQDPLKTLIEEVKDGNFTSSGPATCAAILKIISEKIKNEFEFIKNNKDGQFKDYYNKVIPAKNVNIKNQVDDIIKDSGELYDLIKDMNIKDLVKKIKDHDQGILDKLKSLKDNIFKYREPAFQNDIKNYFATKKADIDNLNKKYAKERKKKSKYKRVKDLKSYYNSEMKPHTQDFKKLSKDSDNLVKFWNWFQITIKYNNFINYDVVNFGPGVTQKRLHVLQCLSNINSALTPIQEDIEKIESTWGPLSTKETNDQEITDKELKDLNGLITKRHNVGVYKRDYTPAQKKNYDLVKHLLEKTIKYDTTEDVRKKIRDKLQELGITGITIPTA